MKKFLNYNYKCLHFFYKLYHIKYNIDNDPLVQYINDILKKHKKCIRKSYTFYIEHTNPDRKHILKTLKVDIERMFVLRRFFFFGIITESQQGIFVTFFLERPIEYYYHNPFKNIYKYINLLYRNYVFYRIKQPFIFIKNLTKQYYMNKLYNYYIYIKDYIYYILFQIDIIKSIDNSHPILFIQRWYYRFYTLFSLFFSIFKRYPWLSNKRYLNILARNFYFTHIFEEVWYKRWFKTLFYKFDKILEHSTFGAAKEEFKDQFIFFVPPEGESPFQIQLKKHISLLRTDNFSEESKEALKILGQTSRFIGDDRFKSIKDNYSDIKW